MAAVQGFTADELAGDLDLHVTTVRFHLDQLVAAGLVEAEFTRAFGVGRPRKVYRVGPQASGLGDDHAMALLSELLTASFGLEGTPRDAGESWSRRHVPATGEPPATTRGAWLGKLGRLLDVLEEWGYSPELSSDAGGRTSRLDLRHCPFRELAREHEDVVCGIHRGLLRGVMQQLGEPDVHVALEPFVEPDLCRAHLTTSQPFSTDRRSS